MSNQGSEVEHVLNRLKIGKRPSYDVFKMTDEERDELYNRLRGMSYGEMARFLRQHPDLPSQMSAYNNFRLKQLVQKVLEMSKERANAE